MHFTRMEVHTPGAGRWSLMLSQPRAPFQDVAPLWDVAPLSDMTPLSLGLGPSLGHGPSLRCDPSLSRMYPFWDTAPLFLGCGPSLSRCGPSLGCSIWFRGPFNTCGFVVLQLWCEAQGPQWNRRKDCQALKASWVPSTARQLEVSLLSLTSLFQGRSVPALWVKAWRPWEAG